MESKLYPVSNACRQSLLLDGLWNFSFDPKEQGMEKGWNQTLPEDISMPVPASFSDLFTEKEKRDYTGTFWYSRTFHVPSEWKGRRVYLRFGSVTHRCTVYVNGKEIRSHAGGFLPFEADFTDAAVFGAENTVCVKANNELSEETIPCGATQTLPDGRKIARPYFDFFNYSGIQRSVWLEAKPQTSIADYETVYTISPDQKRAEVHVRTVLDNAEGNEQISVRLYDAEGNLTAEGTGADTSLSVSDPHLWKVRNAYLYTLQIEACRDGRTIDQYSDRIGIRTVKIDGTRILINGEPVYLKGFGKHEDFEVIGRGTSLPVIKRDFECMKWTGANCFRTSHYPYAEEWYQMADREGFLIIDEVPAVGMMRSFSNFAAAGSGKYTSFFEADTVPELQKVHRTQVLEMIQRDKNHPSVFAFSLFNEPETISRYAHDYFAPIFAAAKEADPQKRPLTGALEKTSSPEKCQCYPLLDFICLNRYYGWYIQGGPWLPDARRQFRDEMDQWKAKNLNVPFVFTEFGTDTLSSEHKLPAIMWSQEYQDEYLEMNFSVFDSYDFIQGELVWNFADFQTTEGIMRVNGNKKGVFTRNRQPKDAAFVLKKRWESR